MCVLLLNPIRTALILGVHWRGHYSLDSKRDCDLMGLPAQTLSLARKHHARQLGAESARSRPFGYVDSRRYERGPYLRFGQDRFGIHGWTRGRSPNLFVAGRGVSGVFPTLHKREQFFGVQGNFRHPRIVLVCCGRGKPARKSGTYEFRARFL